MQRSLILKIILYFLIIVVIVQSLSHIWLFATPWAAACQASLSHWVCSESCPLSQWSYLTILLSSTPFFSFCLQSFPASGSFPMSWLFTSGDRMWRVLELQHQTFHWMFRADLLQNGLVVSPCSPRDSQESSPTPQFKSINSSGLSFLHSPALTSIHDHRKNHSLIRRTFFSKVVPLLFNVLQSMGSQRVRHYWATNTF